ncbi:APC family permease [Candidatus Odyssella thessalonicensis]|uniref:APC family permease n=1 Tax=Candidatus Odyssella thessalonicensis TaxID=84647 RepID=UPI000225B20D|nr:APC family permease [Candidatus Odyssella thessalonicensis]
MDQKTELAAGSLSITESIIMGVSGTSPSYSAAATTAALIGAVGIYSPSSVIICGLIMLGITVSFMFLNKLSPNAGASYVWIRMIFNQKLGFLAGWSLLVATALFMVSGTIPAATATLALVKPEVIDDPIWVTCFAGGWLTFVSIIVLKGIRQTSVAQMIFTIIEVAIMLFIMVAALIAFLDQPIQELSWSLFNPFNTTLETFTRGALIALFFFWGWDVTMNLNEETKDPDSIPGKAAFWSMVINILLFLVFILCTLVALTDQEIQQSSTNVLLKIAEKILPSPWANIALISIILSTIGTIETSMLQFTRTLFSKARDGVLHPRWGKVHKTWKTPWTATIVVWALGIGFLIVASHKPTVRAIMTTSIDVISFQVAFYYSLCAIACAWHFRNVLKEDFIKSLLLIVWPIVSALTLTLIAVYAAVYSFDSQTVLLGIGGILTGLIPLAMNRKAFAS